jgi:hypothetical protein
LRGEGATRAQGWKKEGAAATGAAHRRGASRSAGEAARESEIQVEFPLDPRPVGKLRTFTHPGAPDGPIDAATLPLLHTTLFVLGGLALALALLGDAADALVFCVLGLGASLLDRPAGAPKP